MINFLSIISVSTAALSAAYLFAFSRPNNNRKALKRWEKTFDLVAHGQRYRGSRAEKLFTFFFQRQGLIGYRSKSLYKTPSGRYFEIELNLELGEIISWKLDVIDEFDAIEFMKIVNENSSQENMNAQKT